MRKELFSPIIERILSIVPTKSLEDVKNFINQLPLTKTGQNTDKMFQIENYTISFYQYRDIITGDKLLEIWFSYPEEPIGYMRLDPDWKSEPPSQNKRMWEITRVYVRPKFRRQGFSRLMTEIGIALAKENDAHSVVAYPRHVGMLIALLDAGFKPQTGVSEATLRRILAQGRRWYRTDASARRFYYAQEFRSFIQEGSFIMEKVLVKKSFWDSLFKKL